MILPLHYVIIAVNVNMMEIDNVLSVVVLG